MVKKLSAKDKRFNALAQAVGLVCLEWGRLEHGLDEFIEILSPLEKGDVARAITASMDVRSKIQTIKALAYIRKPSEEWLSKMILLLDYIDNDIRPRRNSIIHTGWYMPPGIGLVRRTTKIRFLRPQSRQFKLETQSEVVAKISDVRKLYMDMRLIFFVKFAFFYDYVSPETPRALPARMFQQFLRRAKPGASPAYIRSVRQFPQESSL